MLDYGFRSACCGASIRLGKKSLKNSSLTQRIWICNKCGKRDIDVITKDEAKSMVMKSYSDEIG